MHLSRGKYVLRRTKFLLLAFGLVGCAADEPPQTLAVYGPIVPNPVVSPSKPITRVVKPSPVPEPKHDDIADRVIDIERDIRALRDRISNAP